MYDLETIAQICANDTAVCQSTDASDHAIDQAGTDLKQAADHVWSLPPTSFSEIIQRALVARQYADRCPDTGKLLHLSSDTPAGDRACAELIEAVLAVARREGHLR